MAPPHRGFTLLEMLIVCVLAGVAIAIAAPRARAFADSFAVDGAARDIRSAFAHARLIALRNRGAEVHIDSARVAVHSAGGVALEKRIADAHDVRVRTTVAVVRYAATGMALGLSNGSIYISRGRAADTLVVSRLGRVRR